MLPFQPESVEVLRARYPEAVAEIVDLEGVRLGSVATPGQSRRHVFDTREGVRLIVSRERTEPTGVVVVHLSGSLLDGSPVEETLTAVARTHGPREVAQQLCGRIEALFREVSGETRELIFLGFTPDKGIPHWHLHG
jgi:hypothetical protein